jgi:DNA-binding response OmpR family regulator
MPTTAGEQPTSEPTARRICLVEDDVRLAQLLKEKLVPFGYSVHAHHQARTAYEAIAKVRPNLLMLDVMLGDGAGYQVARRVRSDAALFLTPILFISSLGDKREVDYALDQGGDAYLAKPFTLESLVQRLDQLRRLSEALHRRSPVADLYRIDRIKREVDRRLFIEEPFALCSASVDYHDAYAARHGEEAATEVATCLASDIAHVLRDQGYAMHCLSHVEGAHFLFFAPPGSYKKVCGKLVHRFAETSTRFYDAVEREQQYMVASKHRGVYAGYPLMQARVCVAHSEHKHFASAREVVAQLDRMRVHSHEKDEERLFTFKQGKKW